MTGPPSRPKRARASPAKRPRASGRPPHSRGAASGEAAQPAKAPARWHHFAAGAAGAAGVAALAFGSLVGGYARHSRPAEASSIEVDWPPDLGPDAAAAKLESLGLVRNAALAGLYLRAAGGTSDFVPGPHLLRVGASPAELASMLRRDRGRPKVKLTIPEGFHMFDVAKRVEREGIAGREAFLKAARDDVVLRELGVPARPEARTAEGYLFPATYELPLDSDPKEVVGRLVGEASRRWSVLLADHAQSYASLQGSLGWGRHEIITLASVIEKETGAAEERPLIASVFFNRLQDPTFQPKKLQSDPTASYGCLLEPERIPACAAFAGKPTPDILRDAANRYSTYVTVGLPPGPIAAPGEAALRAVLEPRPTRFLFFVAKGGGKHTFSETLEEHNEAVRKLRELRR